MDTTAIIRELNDAFRTAPVGRVYVTKGIAAMPLEQQAEIMRRVRDFSAFTPDNDPYGEHDFGSFEFAGKTIFWKIDLYEEPGVKSENGEPVVNRVLTIMLADEY